MRQAERGWSHLPPDRHGARREDASPMCTLRSRSDETGVTTGMPVRFTANKRGGAYVESGLGASSARSRQRMRDASGSDSDG
jgi:hypothetical protein